MGVIYNIQRFSLHDGPGIRTTVFFKGCPMRCVWCHNPESQTAQAQLSLFAERCIGCGRCAEICENHENQDGAHAIRYAACSACGKCADVCPSAALEILGKHVSADEILDEVKRDAAFYQVSGGGITLSGGEPTMQPEFAWQLLAGARGMGLNTAMETCGFVPWYSFAWLLPMLDRIYFDIKQMDSTLHKKYTGRDNDEILENLAILCSQKRNMEVVVRAPVIPGYTDQEENFVAMGRFLKGLACPPRVEVLPYNPLAGSKYPRLGRKYIPGEIREEDGCDPARLCGILQDAGVQAQLMR